jgi:hypothetical protein
LDDGSVGGSVKLEGARSQAYDNGSIPSNAKAHWHVQDRIEPSHAWTDAAGRPRGDMQAWKKMTYDKAMSLGGIDAKMDFYTVSPQGVGQSQYIYTNGRIGYTPHTSVFSGNLALPKYTNWGSAYWSVLLGTF